ncbi:PREDICTED: uncharacterized protein LOC104819720 isoform X3 [Tarenaya hassleriana]|uniref:uncharacterized protein LOC104819720 isoform X3 n=1 Tax=Tarenaya hassleriana TaxID=28532 RepID=UPI00053C880C|nr:PREDICTED: uncharacterized protein LOC104819720 isoform X3 [Tarenaya hassleriana]
MFVKKFVEKSTKKPGGSLPEGLRANDVEPRVVFHYGIPSGSCMFGYDPIQKILAVSTRDGRIKLFGKDHTQALLVSEEASTTKFLDFVHNQGILLVVNVKNRIEVWDIDKKLLSHVHVFNGKITSFRVMQVIPYFSYVGDSSGNVTVLRLVPDSGKVVQMDYTIPFVASNGSPGDTAVINILPQPMTERERILLIFGNGVIALWDITESRPILKMGGHGIQSAQHQDMKKATSACWVCPLGSKVVVGYNNGDILIWSIPSRGGFHSENRTQPSIICKLNLGYKSERIPIASLKCVYGEGKASRLYVMGSSSNLLQVVLLNSHTETRTIKLWIHASEPCIDMEIITDVTEHYRDKREYLLVLGKSGRAYAYDDFMIEKYLVASQSKSLPSSPKEIMVKIPFAESSITVAKLLTNSSHILNTSDEVPSDLSHCTVSVLCRCSQSCLKNEQLGRVIFPCFQEYTQLMKNSTPVLPFQTVPKERTHSSTAPFPGFTKVKNVLITGHSDGTISIWDMSCPLLLPVLSLKEQTEQDTSSRGTALTALHYDSKTRLLFSGNQKGTVYIYKFKPEPYATENGFIPFQGGLKKGNNHIVHSVKHIKLNGSVTCLQKSQTSRHLVVGSDQGHVSLVDVEELTVLYQKHIGSDISPGIISLQFQTCSLQGFEKNVLVVATMDSSVSALDVGMGNMVGANVIKPKKPFKALFMQILDKRDVSPANGSDTVEDITPKQASVLLCSEKAVYIYSLSHVVQGVKKVLHKKKFGSSSCCFASTFSGASGVGLTLVLADGTVEIRSLPELSLLKQTSIRGFTYSSPKPNSLPETVISASWDGDLVMVNGDQELVVTSVLPRRHTFRHLDSIRQVFRQGVAADRDDKVSVSVSMPMAANPAKEKKGMFGSVFGSGKPKRAFETETEDAKGSVKDLSKSFSEANFPWNVNKEGRTLEDETQLDIDDIELEDQTEQRKEQGMLSGINKQKLASKFITSFKGKLKQKKKEKVVKSETSTNNEEKCSNAVDEIKKRYGFSPSGAAGAARMAESKLKDNLRKLQGISLKTAEMENTAMSFSSTAKELLNAVEQNQRNPKLFL